MFNFFMKKKMRKNSKKGFTLIELIVVIAILGILAAIAIPRFAGFTDKAKKQNDEQYAALVGNSLVVMLASGDLKFKTGVTSAVFTIPQKGSVTAETGKFDPEFVSGDLEKLVKPKDLKYYTTLEVTVTSDGEHSITNNRAPTT